MTRHGVKGHLGEARRLSVPAQVHLEVRVIQRLLGSQPLGRIPHQQPGQQVHACAHAGHKVVETLGGTTSKRGTDWGYCK